MKTNTIVKFNESGRRKFPKSADRLFLYVGDVENNPDYMVVKGFRGKYLISDEMFIESKNDIVPLTSGEIEEIMKSTPDQ